MVSIIANLPPFQITRKTGVVPLERGENKVRLPTEYNIVGFSPTSGKSVVGLIWEAPGGLPDNHWEVIFHVIPVGETFTVEADGYQVVGSLTALQPVVIYQVWNFPKG
jgi:hypothetical protein